MSIRHFRPHSRLRPYDAMKWLTRQISHVLTISAMRLLLRRAELGGEECEFAGGVRLGFGEPDALGETEAPGAADAVVPGDADGEA